MDVLKQRRNMNAEQRSKLIAGFSEALRQEEDFETKVREWMAKHQDSPMFIKTLKKILREME
jgi:hypothetical protein